MISFLDPGGEVFLANLSRIESANQQTEEQISSGVRINQPEDAPDEVTQLLQLQASLAGNNQVQANLTQAQNSAQTADQAISNALTLANQAESLGAQGSSITTADSRQNLGQQVQAILQQMVSISQTAINGRYIFSGDADRAAQYQIDPSSPNGVDRLSTAANTQQVQDANGNSFATGLTAEQLFDHRNADDSFASDNMFAALTSLANALNNNDTDGINNALASLKSATSYLGGQQTFYGTLENRLTSSMATATSLNTSLTTQISQIRDTDLSQAAVQLTQGQTELQAALTAQSKVPHTSLFDFLG